MTTLENKTTGIPKAENQFANYADLLLIQVNKPLSNAVDLKAMRRDLRLLDVLEAAGETIELNDEDLQHLVALVEDSQWPLKHKDIITFAEYIAEFAKK